MVITEPEKLHILKHSFQILRNKPEITPTLIHRLSFSILAHSWLTGELYENGILLIIFQFIYLLFIFIAVFIFSRGKPVSVSPDPPVITRLCYTFCCVGVLMLMCTVPLSYMLDYFTVDPTEPLISMPPHLDFAIIRHLMSNLKPLHIIIGLLMMLVHLYLIVLWNLAGVVCVLETDVTVYGLAAVKKSYQLIRGKVLINGVVLGLGYFLVCWAVNGVFEVVVVDGESMSIAVRVVVGWVLIGFLFIVNLASLSVHGVFYYVCKKYHHERIGETALKDFLDGYLREYVPYQLEDEECKLS